MASALIRKIEKDFLSCCICFEELTDPVGLPCLHVFCLECLDDWSKTSTDKTQVICPTCKTPAPMPKEGIRGFPRHFLVKNLKETVDMNKMAQETQNVTCNTCGKMAVMHCVDCKKSLCQQCHTYHNAFIKDHIIVTIEELQSGQVTDEGRLCEVHGEQVRYYCETQQKLVCTDCVGLKTCPHNHHHMTLKNAAKIHVSSIDNLMKQCTHTKLKFQDAVKEAKRMIEDLTEAKDQVQTELGILKGDCKMSVDQIFKKYENRVETVTQEKIKKLDENLSVLRSGICKVEEACKQGTHITQSGSDYLITTKYSSLSKTLTGVSQLQPVVAGRELGYLKFDATKWQIPSFGHVLQRKTWKLCRKIKTTGLIEPVGIALNQDGDIAIGCCQKGVKIYTNKGDVRCTLYDSHGAPDVAITPDNRYVIGPINKQTIQFYNNQGKLLSTTPITCIKNRPSNVNSITVDSQGRIIVGLVDNLISIHHADGSLISKFATQSTSNGFATTSQGQIVSSFFYTKIQQGKSLELMDYSGGNGRLIPPPADVRTWRPASVCCGQGEIFVVNSSLGDPTGIYRYTDEGVYLGCVTTNVRAPTGIALSKNGMELFVAERCDKLVKIFHRE